MNIFALIIGIAIPTLAGWMLIRITEGSKPVLLRLERWFIGFVLGCALFTFTAFILERIGVIGFTLIGFIITSLLLFLILGTVVYKKRGKLFYSDVIPASSPPLNKFAWILILLIGAWIAVKIITGSILLVVSPPFQDDVINNWNYRGKVFFHTQELTLDLERGHGIVSSVGVSSYPPSVPLMKTWLSTLNGNWSEGLANSIHILWYLSALYLLYCAIRRYRSKGWALLGVYLISSIPLYLIHGSIAYADVFVSLYLFIILTSLYGAMRCKYDGKRTSFLRIGAITLALLIFTKNEGLALYVPIIALFTLIVISRYSSRKSLLFYIGSGAAVLMPWLIFKWANGLSFGNAKSVTKLSLGWQEGVMNAAWTNLFMNGNWIFLFLLLIVLLVFAYKKAWKGKLVIVTGFILAVIFAQLVIFLFTNLSVEAVMGTGYSRGIIHLVPLIVFLCIMLLPKSLSPSQKVSDSI